MGDPPLTYEAWWVGQDPRKARIPPSITKQSPGGVCSRHATGGRGVRLVLLLFLAAGHGLSTQKLGAASRPEAIQHFGGPQDRPNQDCRLWNGAHHPGLLYPRLQTMQLPCQKGRGRIAALARLKSRLDVDLDGWHCRMRAIRQPVTNRRKRPSNQKVLGRS